METKQRKTRNGDKIEKNEKWRPNREKREMETNKRKTRNGDKIEKNEEWRQN